MRDLWSFFFYMLISGILRETFLYKSKLIVQQNDPNSEWFALCLKSFLYFWVFVCVCECDCATAYICISPPGDLYTAKAGLSSWTGPGSSRCDPYTQHTVREKQKHAGGRHYLRVRRYLHRQTEERCWMTSYWILDCDSSEGVDSFSSPAALTEVGCDSNHSFDVSIVAATDEFALSGFSVVVFILFFLCVVNF